MEDCNAQKDDGTPKACTLLVPKLELGNAIVGEGLLRERSGSWSFQDIVLPKLELGNEGLTKSFRVVTVALSRDLLREETWNTPMPQF
jgi:hypothetical protein